MVGNDGLVENDISDAKSALSRYSGSLLIISVLIHLKYQGIEGDPLVGPSKSGVGSINFGEIVF